MAKYQRIVFIQGEEASEPLLILDDHGRDAAITYLLQWDNEPGELADEPSHGKADNVYATDGLILSWNGYLGYIGLERIVG